MGCKYLPLLFFSSVCFAQHNTSIPAFQVEVADEFNEGVSQNSEARTFSAAEIQKSSGSDLADFFRKQGLSIKRQGGDGQTSALYLRGANADQVLVLIDGVPMNDSSNTDRRFDFSRIPLSEIRRIEILEGAQSVRYGSQAIGGVIRIWTHATQEKSSYKAAVKAGSFQTHELSGSAVQALGLGFHAGLSGQFYETAGFSSAKGGAEDDAHRSQTGAGHLSFSNESLRSQYIFRRTDQLTDLDRGGGAANDDPNFISRFRQDTHSFATSFFPNDKSTYELLTAYSKVERHADNKPDANSLEDSFGDYRGEQRRLQLSSQNLIGNSDLTLGFDYTAEEAKGQSTYSVFPKSTAHKSDFFAAIDHKLKNWILNSGLRSENHSQFGHELSPEAGVSYQLNRNQKLKLRWSKATKWPSLFQLYDPTFGNDMLKPEKSTSVELSWNYQNKNFELSTTVFENRYQDLVALDAVTFQSINQGKAKIRGFEVDSEYSYSEFFTRLRYQYLEPRQTDVGQELVRRARHEIFISEGLRKNKFEGSVDVKYNSRREDLSNTGRIYLPEFWVFGAEISYQLNGYRVWASAENLGQSHYQEVAGYQSTPRSFWAGLSADF